MVIGRGYRTAGVPEDGTATGIVQWMQVDLAEGVSFDNHTDGGRVCAKHRRSGPVPDECGETKPRREHD